MTANGGAGTCPLANHWLDQPAACMEILIAAAGQPLR